MKNQTRSISRLPASALVLTLTLLSSFAAAQSMPPSGSFGFLIHASYYDPTHPAFSVAFGTARLQYRIGLNLELSL